MMVDGLGLILRFLRILFFGVGGCAVDVRLRP